MRYLLTGAAGFLGSHIAEALTRRGKSVVAVLRPGADATFLNSLGDSVQRGDLLDPAFCQAVLDDVDVVIHCAARVDHWAPVADLRRDNVDSLRVLLEACKAQALSRFVHLSCLDVYPLRNLHDADESYPLPARHRDPYAQTKIEAENLALAYYRDFGVPVVILRAGHVYGPRDRTFLPPLIADLQENRFRYIGDGSQTLPTLFVRNFLDALFLALGNENAVGEVYNLTDGEHVSRRQLMQIIADSLGLPRPAKSSSSWLTSLRTRLSERWARRRGQPDAPRLNLARFRLLAVDLDVSIQKAKFEIGYLPRYNVQDALEETLAWHKTNE